MTRTVVAGVLALQAITPAPKFDAGRAWEHLRQLVAIGPRPSGSPAIEQTRKYIKDQLAAAGLTAVEQAWEEETPIDKVKKKSEGMSIFLVDTKSKGLTVKSIRNMVNHETNEVFIDNLEVPAENLIGEEGKGFKYILDGLNAERILIAAECVGDGYWFVDRATKYSKDRVVFGRPIGQNQGIQFPIAESYMEIEAANLMRWKACELFDAHQPCGAQANMAKYLAAKASWEAANVCLQMHGGFGFACEYDVERKFRETRLYQVAPISTNLIFAYVAEHVLGLPRSF